MKRCHRLWLPLAGVPLVMIACAALWAALAPIVVDSRDEVFEIPQGTWARRMAGDKIDILPDEIHLTLGINDILVLKNRDNVPQIFGPTLMMPGQNFSLPFEVASSYVFACTAHASGQLTVIVNPAPTSAADRMAWRLQRLKSFAGQSWRDIRS